MIQGAWIRPGAVVFDVGINRTDAGPLVGDVEYALAATARGGSPRFRAASDP